MPYDFQYVEAQKLKLTDEERKRVAKLYEQWSKEIKNGYNLPSDMSGPAKNKNFQMIQLRKALREEAKHISEQVEKGIKSSLYVVSDKTVSSMLGWMKDLGVNGAKIHATMASIPTNVVENLVNGSVYGAKGSWNLSKAIWGDNQKTLSSLYQIVAGGMAQNKTIYEIAQELSKFVNPRASKQWNLKTKDGARIYPKKVDYASQRLARTLSQHVYQQTVVQMNKGNPFILGIRWRANGPRVCDICRSRDGHVYHVNELPLDHPNGMCVMEPIYLADADDMIAKWATSPAGTYPQFDEWAKGFGYEFNSNNPSTPVTNIMRNEDTVKVAKQNYKNDVPVDTQTWVRSENSREYDRQLNELRERFSAWLKDDDQEEIMNAFVAYTRNDIYEKLNRTLREKGPNALSPRLKEVYSEMSKGYSNSISNVKETIYLHRQVKMGEFRGVFGTNIDPTDMTAKELANMFNDAIITYDNFMSTSVKGGYFGDEVVEYFIKADSFNGMHVESISRYGYEKEMLLNRGAKFRVVGVEDVIENTDNKGKKRIFLEMIE